MFIVEPIIEGGVLLDFILMGNISNFCPLWLFFKSYLSILLIYLKWQ